MSKQLKISKVVTDDVAAVEVSFDFNDGRGAISASGSSKRHPKDNPNSEIGLSLAASRAFAQLSERLEDNANGQIVMAQLLSKFSVEDDDETNYSN